MKKYGMTKKKIIHLIAESDQNGINGYWYAACGKWIMPTEVTETVPDGGRMCLQCQKKSAVRGAGISNGPMAGE